MWRRDMKELRIPTFPQWQNSIFDISRVFLQISRSAQPSDHEGQVTAVDNLGL